MNEQNQEKLFDSLPKRAKIEQYGTYEFALERLTDELWDELVPLALAHYEETKDNCANEGLVLDKDLRQKKNREGALIVGIMRQEGAVIGYCSMHVMRGLTTNYTKAIDDALYIKPEHRHGKVFHRLMTYAERLADDFNVQKIRLTVAVGARHAEYLKYIGYKEVSVVLEKELYGRR